MLQREGSNDLPDDDPYANELILYGSREDRKTKEIDIMTKGNPSNYVLAGVDTFAALVNRFLKSHPGYFNDEQIDLCLSRSVDKFLFSYGTALNYKTKKIANNYSGKISKLIHTFIEFPFMQGTSLYIDSGGFQVSMGAVESKDIPKFIDLYYQFLADYHKEFKYAFILDIPPGPGTDTFQSYDQVYQLNKLSYTKAQELPEEAKQKIIYIHHFRTPQIYSIWKKLLFEDDLGTGYNYYATGGLVAYGSSDITIPAVLYSIPLSSIVQYAKKEGLKSFKFHVLGGANFIDVFYHKIFAKHVLERHDIDIQITYDSSSIFKGVFGARYIATFKSDGTLERMSLKSNALHLKFEGDETVEDHLYKDLNRVATIHGLAQLSSKNEPVYVDETGTLSKQVATYLMLYVFQLYKDIEDLSDKIIDDLYPLYINNKIPEFDSAIKKVTQAFNKGKLTKKQKSKSTSIYNTLQILDRLDEDYSEHFINKFTSTDDSAKLNTDGLMTF